ncbi:MAG: Flp family type IVb pilin [Armatimonadetes bacterium]|nr:Flp family type IVb pilin [Armatimonadota bacterium]
MLGEFWRTIAVFFADEDGVTTLEYAIMVALVALGSVGAWTRLIDLSDTMGKVADDTADAFQRMANRSP